MNKNLIHSGHWSKGYKEGPFFVKVLNRYIPKATIREAKASLIAEAAGIRTPHFIKTLNCETSVSNIYEYVQMDKMTNEYVINHECARKGILGILQNLEQIEWDSHDDYWYTLHIKEFEYEFQFINIDTSRYINFLKELTPSVFIHGDFSCGNLGINSSGVILYDFQHGSFGPKGWDRAYLASTFMPKDTLFLGLNEKEIKMAEIISAIKVGRAIKKQMANLNVRQDIFNSWKELGLKLCAYQI